MHELPMLHGVSAILYGKTGAVVQASETQRAFLFRPYRIAVLAFYGLFRGNVRSNLHVAWVTNDVVLQVSLVDVTVVLTVNRCLPCQLNILASQSGCEVCRYAWDVETDSATDAVWHTLLTALAARYYIICIDSLNRIRVSPSHCLADVLSSSSHCTYRAKGCFLDILFYETALVAIT